MVDRLKQSRFDEIGKLIRRGGELCDRSRDTREIELYEFKQACSLLLGSVGGEVEGLYRRLTELDFKTPSGVSRYTRASGRGILDPDDQVYRTLNEMVAVLKAAQARMQAGQHEPDEQPPRHKSGEKASKATPYSKQDAAVFDLIGPQKFIHVTNDALYRQFRHRVRTRLGKNLSYNAFRSIANRIRTYHGFPTSENVRKGDQS